METRQKLCVEDSCKELQTWIERLRKLDDCGLYGLKKYFSRNNVWVDDMKPFGFFMGNGAESYVYKGYDEKDVFKFKKCKLIGVCSYIDSLVNLLEDTLNHNRCFPDTYYSLVGFSSKIQDHLGAMAAAVILRQEFVKGESATHEQILAHLKKDGFTIIGSAGHYRAIKNGFQVNDIDSKNAIFSNNRVYIIDCHITKYI